MRELGVLGHLRALVPGQRAAQLLGQRRDRGGDRVADRLGAVPGQRGPVLDAGSSPWPSMRGRCSSIVNRVVRSTSVPIAELSSPRIRSPSQWPGTARSSASAGRSLIMTSGVTNFLPRPCVRARGTRSARPVRRQAVSPAQRAAALDVQRLVDGLEVVDLTPPMAVFRGLDQ